MFDTRFMSRLDESQEKKCDAKDESKLCSASQWSDVSVEQMTEGPVE